MTLQTRSSNTCLVAKMNCLKLRHPVHHFVSKYSCRNLPPIWLAIQRIHQPVHKCLRRPPLQVPPRPGEVEHKRGALLLQERHGLLVTPAHRSELHKAVVHGRVPDELPEPVQAVHRAHVRARVRELGRHADRVVLQRLLALTEVNTVEEPPAGPRLVDLFSWRPWPAIDTRT